MKNYDHSTNNDRLWRGIYRVGAFAALAVVFVALSEIIITFFPGGERVDPGSITVVDWFDTFQDNWFIGLRNLGLLNIIMTALAIPIYLALFGVHRRVNEPYAAIAVIVAFIGVSVFFATNRAFPMLDLANQYAAATSDSQKTMLEAAGQSMLSVGQSHTPGTFLGFFFAQAAGIIMSIVMLLGKVFSKTTAYIGIISFSSFLIFEVFSSFASSLFGVSMVFAMIGGLLGVVWYILIARRLFRIHSLEEQAIS